MKRISIELEIKTGIELSISSGSALGQAESQGLGYSPPPFYLWSSSMSRPCYLSIK